MPPQKPFTKSIAPFRQAWLTILVGDTPALPPKTQGVPKGNEITIIDPFASSTHTMTFTDRGRIEFVFTIHTSTGDLGWSYGMTALSSKIY